MREPRARAHTPRASHRPRAHANCEHTHDRASPHPPAHARHKRRPHGAPQALRRGAAPLTSVRAHGRAGTAADASPRAGSATASPNRCAPPRAESTTETHATLHSRVSARAAGPARCHQQAHGQAATSRAPTGAAPPAIPTGNELGTTEKARSRTASARNATSARSGSRPRRPRTSTTACGDRSPTDRRRPRDRAPTESSPPALRAQRRRAAAIPRRTTPHRPAPRARRLTGRCGRHRQLRRRQRSSRPARRWAFRAQARPRSRSIRYGSTANSPPLCRPATSSRGSTASRSTSTAVRFAKHGRHAACEQRQCAGAHR